MSHRVKEVSEKASAWGNASWPEVSQANKHESAGEWLSGPLHLGCWVQARDGSDESSCSW